MGVVFVKTLSGFTYIVFSTWKDELVHILAEGAIALSVTLSGGALFAS